jgi:hypothetical protein
MLRRYCPNLISIVAAVCCNASFGSESAPDALCAVRLSVLDGARECDSDMRRTGFIERNNSRKNRLSRRVAELAGPPGELESATYRDDLYDCNPTLLRRETLDFRAECIAIGSDKLRGSLSAAVVRINDHTGQPSESAQVRRLTRIDTSHLATIQAIIGDRLGFGSSEHIVASDERTPIVPECGKREPHNRGERHHQACRSPVVRLEHDFTPRQRVSVDAALLSIWNGFHITLPRALRGTWVSSSVEAAGTAMGQHHSPYPDRIHQECQPHSPWQVTA